MAEKKKKLKKIKLQKTKFSDSERKQQFMKAAAWKRETRFNFEEKRSAINPSGPQGDLDADANAERPTPKL